MALTAGLATSVLPAAWGQKAGTNATAKAEPATANVADMGDMAMPTYAKMAKSTGTVTAIDKAVGKTTPIMRRSR